MLKPDKYSPLHMVNGALHLGNILNIFQGKHHNAFAFVVALRVITEDDGAAAVGMGYAVGRRHGGRCQEIDAISPFANDLFVGDHILGTGAHKSIEKGSADHQAEAYGNKQGRKQPVSNVTAFYTFKHQSTGEKAPDSAKNYGEIILPGQ